MTNKKIAFFVIDYSCMGGVERVTSNLIGLFDTKGIRAEHLISMYQQNENVFMSYPDFLHTKVLLNKGESKSEIVDRLASYLMGNNITDLIYQGDNMTTTLAIQKACKKANCNNIAVYHGSPHAYFKRYSNEEDRKSDPILPLRYFFTRVQYLIKKPRLKKVIDEATMFVCVGSGIVDELNEWYHFSEAEKHKIVCIHNPLTFDVNAINADFSCKEKIVTYVSRLERKHKNSLFILKVWKELATKYPDWKLLLLGGGGLRSKMEAFVKEHQLHNVNFEGQVKNVGDYLNKSSITTLTSYCEGFGMGLAEASCYKNALVVVKSDGGIKDIVIESVTGFLSPQGDVKKMAENLERVMVNKELRMQLGENAAQNMVQFSDDIIFQQWQALFRNI